MTPGQQSQDDPTPASNRGPGQLSPGAPPLPREVVALGWVSFFTDAASDMIYPLLPLFLIQLGGGAEALGWIEGVAEAVSAGVKLFAGRAVDRAGDKKRLVAVGYAVAALSRPLYALATTPVHAVFVRALDRVGKGLRGPPRDAILAGAAPPESRGRAFGFHRMMDNLGGVAGPLVAFALLRFARLPLRTVFALSLGPGLVSVAIVLLAVRRDAPTAPTGKAGAAPDLGAGPKGALSRGAIGYFAALGVFSLAASGDIFLVRRLSDLGLDASLIPFAWLSLQLMKSALNMAGGRASDRFGRRRVLVLAWAIYAASYVAFGLAPSWPIAWAVLGLYALHYGLAEGGQRALVAEIVPLEARGRAFGVQLAVEGIMVLPANVVFGAVYDRIGPEAAFLGAAAIAALGALALALAPIKIGGSEAQQSTEKDAAEAE
ncbi:MAG TPA: MFS transporter [Byssovorax sp.]